MDDRKQLTERAGLAFGWNLAGNLFRIGAQFSAMLVLVRLLPAEAFGRAAVAFSVIGVSHMLAHAGISYAIVQRKKLDREEIEAASFASVMLSLLMIGVVFLSAPAFAWLLNDDAYKPILRSSATILIFYGVVVVPLALQRRGLEFKSLVTINFVAYSVGYCVVGVGLAWLGCDYWALVFAAITHEGLRAVATLLVMGTRFTSCRSLKSLGRLAHFCTLTSLTTGLLHASRNLDAFIISRMLGADALGYYSKSLQLAKMPSSTLAGSANAVLLSAFSRLQESKDDLLAAYYSSLKLAALIAVPMAATAIMLSEPIVLVLLGDAWKPAALPLCFLSVTAYFVCVSDIADRVIIAHGIDSQRLRLHLSLACVSGVALLVGSLFGIGGAAAGAMAGALVQFMATAHLSLKLSGGKLRAVIASQVPGLTVASACVLCLVIINLSPVSAFSLHYALLAKLSISVMVVLLSFAAFPHQLLPAPLVRKLGDFRLGNANQGLVETDVPKASPTR